MMRATSKLTTNTQHAKKLARGITATAKKPLSKAAIRVTFAESSWIIMAM